MTELVAKAKSMADRAENYEEEGNYEYAVKCYREVRKLLKTACEQTTKPEHRVALEEKINKYKIKEDQMKEKSLNKNT